MGESVPVLSYYSLQNCGFWKGSLPAVRSGTGSLAAWNALPKLNTPLIRRGQALSTKAMKKLSFSLQKPPYPLVKGPKGAVKRIRVPYIQGSKNA